MRYLFLGEYVLLATFRDTQFYETEHAANRRKVKAQRKNQHVAVFCGYTKETVVGSSARQPKKLLHFHSLNGRA